MNSPDKSQIKAVPSRVTPENVASLRCACLMKTCNASRVIEPRIETRSANLVGETKVDCEDLLFSQMCAGVNAPWRTKSPLMAFAQKANRHEAFISQSA